MELTIELDTCKFIIHLERNYSHAVFISKLTGESVSMSVPDLIEILNQASKYIKTVPNE